MQYIDGFYWVSSGHNVFVFDSEWSLQRRIFLNNSFLIGEESANDATLRINNWAKYDGYKSYIYDNKVYVANTFGDIEIYELS
jgi:hypothetical protein